MLLVYEKKLNFVIYVALLLYFCNLYQNFHFDPREVLNAGSYFAKELYTILVKWITAHHVNTWSSY